MWECGNVGEERKGKKEEYIYIHTYIHSIGFLAGGAKGGGKGGVRVRGGQRVQWDFKRHGAPVHEICWSGLVWSGLVWSLLV